MLSVILCWIYIGITSFLIGFFVLDMIATRFGYTSRKISAHIVAGLVVATVYAQIFSLFAKVGLLSNLLLLLFCVGIVITKRRALSELIKMQRQIMSFPKVLGFVTLTIVMAYFTSAGTSFYDTPLYHAQSIRWIEEYGIVPGLGNLHCRLGYNSASFSLSALYSFSFLGIQSFHCVPGFIALLLVTAGSKAFQILIPRKRDNGDSNRYSNRNLPQLSDLVGLTAIYYVSTIVDEMISPASDYFVVMIIFYLVLQWTILLEQKEMSPIPYGLLCLLAVYGVTVKLSVLLIVLLVVKPAVMLIKEKKWKVISLYIFLGLFIAAPYLIRNVIISGWLLYPSTTINLFLVDWKVPEGIANYDFKEIQVWGRGSTDVLEYGQPITEWFSHWISNQRMVVKLLLVAGISTFFWLPIKAVYVFVKKKWSLLDELHLELVIMMAFAFWLFTAPLFRYGVVLVCLAPLIPYGKIGLRIVRIKQLYILLFAGFLLWKTVGLGKLAVDTHKDGYLFLQEDYENFETTTYDVDGISIYIPVEGDRTGYEAFPSAQKEENIELRGEDLSSGFRSKNVE